MPTPVSRGRHRMADRPARRIPPARQVWSVWVVNPLVFGLVALPLTLAGQVRRCSIGQVPYQGLHPVSQDENAESRSLPGARARPATGQHPSRQTVRSGS